MSRQPLADRLRTYRELRARHPQLPDDRWVARDGITVDLSEAPLVTVDLTMVLIDPETPIADVDLGPLGYGLDDPGEPLPIYAEALQACTFRSRKADAIARDTERRRNLARGIA